MLIQNITEAHVVKGRFNSQKVTKDRGVGREETKKILGHFPKSVPLLSHTSPL